ncbi:MAG: aspartate carbamoyltransferase regulatory subunit [Chlamydiia bacterium]|nr:aspartate carbamoyltransferase regulatory subunit [Chlamydiia bacterium]
MMPTQRYVSEISNGTVIDHIPAGQALEVVRLLDLEKHRERVTIGLNLISPSLGRKDVVKIENRELTPDEANVISILAPDCTIAIISDYGVKRKFKVALPKEISDHGCCPNASCISNHEPIGSKFNVSLLSNGVELHCHYCRETIRPKTPKFTAGRQI